MLYDGWVGGVAGAGKGEVGRSRDGWKCWLNRGHFCCECVKHGSMGLIGYLA